MSVSETYLIWGCCNVCEEEDSLEDAKSLMYGMEWGDGHSPYGIECPDGTLIRPDDPEYQQYSKERHAAEKASANNHQARYKERVVGTLIIKSPFSMGWDRESFTDTKELERAAEEAKVRFGEDRVRVEN